MTRLLLMINLTLGLLVIMVALDFRDSWTGFEDSHGLNSIQVDPNDVGLMTLAGAIAIPDSNSVPDWTEAAGNNPFSFDRSDVPILPEVEAAAADVSAAEIAATPRPMLYGTMLLGNDQVAMLASERDRGTGYRPVRVGESVDGWELVEVQQKAVIVALRGFRQTLEMGVPILQSNQGRTRTVGRTGNQQPTIVGAAVPVTTGGGPTATPSAAAEGTDGAAAPTVPTQVIRQTPFGPSIEIIE